MILKPIDSEKKKPWWLRLFGALLYLGLLGGIGYVASVWSVTKKAAPKMAPLVVKSIVSPPSAEKVFGEKSLNLLLLGTDETYFADGSHTTASVRSDLMMLLRVDFEKQVMTGLSLPRDVMFRLPKHDKELHKLNAFHAYGGAELTKSAVEALTKVKIDRVASFNDVAFIELVNLVGGVVIDSDKPLNYTDRAGGLYIRIAQGANRLNGYKALGYVRFRHNDDDFARQARQKKFIGALKDRLARDPQRAAMALEKAPELVSNAFTPEEFLILGRFVLTIPKDRIQLSVLPTFTREGKMFVQRSALPSALRSLGLEPTLGDPSDASLDESLVPDPPKPVVEPIKKPSPPKQPTIKGGSTPKPGSASKNKLAPKQPARKPSHP